MVASVLVLGVESVGVGVTDTNQRDSSEQTVVVAVVVMWARGSSVGSDGNDSGVGRVANDSGC